MNASVPSLDTLAKNNKNSPAEKYKLSALRAPELSTADYIHPVSIDLFVNTQYLFYFRATRSEHCPLQQEK